MIVKEIMTEKKIKIVRPMIEYMSCKVNFLSMFLQKKTVHFIIGVSEKARF